MPYNGNADPISTGCFITLYQYGGYYAYGNPWPGYATWEADDKNGTLTPVGMASQNTKHHYYEVRQYWKSFSGEYSVYNGYYKSLWIEPGNGILVTEFEGFMNTFKCKCENQVLELLQRCPDLQENEFDWDSCSGYCKKDRPYQFGPPCLDMCE